MKTPPHVISQQFSVRFDYPVVFTRDVFEPANAVLADTLRRCEPDRVHRVMVFVDEGVMRAHPSLAQAISAYVAAHARHLRLAAAPGIVPGGEAVKNDYRLIMQIVDAILEYRMCRQSPIIAIGGGAVLDAVGFSASIIHRGLRMVRLPTTVLAQNDAGIGVKTGMNLHGSKNLLGTFHPPFAVINDFSFLATLADDHWVGGIAEAFKVAVIKDAGFFADLCRDAARLRARDEEAMERLIVRCARLHLDHIRTGGDAFELGAARPLDFGHWCAHKLEMMTGFRLGHGQAVAIGLALDSCYARRQGWLAEGELEAILAGLRDSGLPVWHEALDRRLGDGTPEVLHGIEDFREHLGGDLQLTFPRGIGNRIEVSAMDRSLMAEGMAYLARHHQDTHAHTGTAGTAPDVLP